MEGRAFHIQILVIPFQVQFFSWGGAYEEEEEEEKEEEQEEQKEEEEEDEKSVLDLLFLD